MRTGCRYILATAVVLLSAWLIWGIWRDVQNTPDQIRTVEYDQSRALAFQFMREDARQFIDATILILAGLWGVAIVKKEDRIKRRDIPEAAMFLVATALMAFFFYCTQRYGHELERAYWDTTSGRQFPDVFNSPYLTLYYRAATKMFYASVCVSAVTVFSLCVIRAQPQRQASSS
jgi:hypothetical protein